jgi:hypothetical protein
MAADWIPLGHVEMATGTRQGAALWRCWKWLLRMRKTRRFGHKGMSGETDWMDRRCKKRQRFKGVPHTQPWTGWP